MSRTIKDKPGYLKDIKRNEEELSRAYIRAENSAHRTYPSDMELCLDCEGFGKNGDGTCDECGDSTIEDLVTLYENSSVA